MRYKLDFPDSGLSKKSIGLFIVPVFPVIFAWGGSFHFRFAIVIVNLLKMKTIGNGLMNANLFLFVHLPERNKNSIGTNANYKI